MSKDNITINIDGRPVTARPGQMLIEVMDEHSVTVPRFCYHPRLSVAANCRMCMVEVEKVPKPLPACATPVAPDMVVRSRSKLALEGQRGTMEMLLINHPLDCPVCDQGGECELQDVSLAHGQSYSRYTEGKRAVDDEDIGSLISTDMTRCIHCTRCVRFGVEVAGQAELGATGRGEDMRIGTFVKHAVSSELSGNMIDVCPVGALNSKPYRMRARAWEMDRYEAIANHDCLGSNTFVHTLRSQLMRVLPRECQDINLSWLSDRDRFSYTALEHPDRRKQPQIFDSVKSRHGDSDWYSAINAASQALLNASQFNELHRVGVLVGCNSSLEEMHLLTQICRRLGIENIDHRLSQIDFSFQDEMPASPGLGRSLEQFEDDDVVMLIGADVRKQQPLFGARLRQSALRGNRISTLNLFREDLNFPVDEQIYGDPDKIFSDLLSIFRHLAKSTKASAEVQKDIASWTNKLIVKPGESHKKLASRLIEGKSANILIGSGAFSWPNFSAIRAIAQALAELTGAHFGFLTPGANTVGAWYTGCLPHRYGLNGQDDSKASKPNGKTVAEMFAEPLDIYILYNCEPEQDSPLGRAAAKAMAQAKLVIDINSFSGPEQYPGVRLPLATAFESPGTYINAFGLWQYHEGSLIPAGRSLPGWKILSMLARACKLDDLEYASCDDLSDEVIKLFDGVQVDNRGGLSASAQVGLPVSLRRLARPSYYHGDAMQRRAEPLQQTVDAACDRLVWLSPDDATRSGIAHGDHINLQQGDQSVRARALCTDGVATGSVLTALGAEFDAKLGEPFAAIELSLDSKVVDGQESHRRASDSEH